MYVWKCKHLSLEQWGNMVQEAIYSVRPSLSRAYNCHQSINILNNNCIVFVAGFRHQSSVHCLST
jgi:hypothetical protein